MIDQAWQPRMIEGMTRAYLVGDRDADFLPGKREAGDRDERYVLCEINVSSVAPFPDSAVAPLVEAIRAIVTPAAPRSN